MMMRRSRILAGTALTLLLALPATGVIAKGDASPAPAQKEWRYFPKPVMAPKGAPNVLLILTDDVGFGSSSTFGGAIPTPVFDAIAARGLRYNEFHTTAMCSPTRAALLTGRNTHAVASGSITNVSIDQPGYTSVIPKSAATVGRVLRDNGYDTAFFGKNHNTPTWQTGPMGPFDNWPNGWGFDYFYGFNGAADDQFRPHLTENRNAIEPPNDPAYVLDKDLADHIIQWTRVQRSQRPDHPFLVYLSPGTMHSPHQAPEDWIAKFKGKFDMGWDKLREQTFARQRSMGIIPADARLTPRPAVLPAWDSLSPEAKRTYARQMEVAAAQLSYFDHQTGRIIDDLRASGQLDNTLIIYVQGDNGASMDSRRGAVQELASLMGIEPTEQELIATSDQNGTRSSYSNYNAAWAWAQNSPFPWGKQIASHLGGLRDGMVISWPERIRPDTKVRSQFHHVIDIVPTIYEAAGITPPVDVDGVKQQPIDGVSMVYSFNNPGAASTRREQYFEMLGNRSYYKDGWLASTTPRAPFDRSAADPMTYPWELYNLSNDYSQSTDLASKYPDKLNELKADFDRAGKRNNVFPLAADLMKRVGPENRPSALGTRDTYVFYAGQTRYPQGSFPNLAAGGAFSAEIECTSAKAQGPIVIIGDEAGGAGLMIQNGQPVFIYNPSGQPQERQRIVGQPLAAGKHEISIAVVPMKQAGPRAAQISMSVDGRVVSSVDVPIYYSPRGEGVVGRYGVRTLLAGSPEPAADGLSVNLVRFKSPETR